MDTDPMVWTCPKCQNAEPVITLTETHGITPACFGVCVMWPGEISGS